MLGDFVLPAFSSKDDLFISEGKRGNNFNKDGIDRVLYALKLICSR